MAAIATDREFRELLIEILDDVGLSGRKKLCVLYMGTNGPETYDTADVVTAFLQGHHVKPCEESLSELNRRVGKLFKNRKDTQIKIEQFIKNHWKSPTSQGVQDETER